MFIADFFKIVLINDRDLRFDVNKNWYESRDRQPAARASRLRVGDLCSAAFESAVRFHFVIQGGESPLAREQDHEPTRRRFALAVSAPHPQKRKDLNQISH